MTRAAIPPLLKHLNERTVFETIRSAAPISRAEISRRAGISKPTVSLALQSLLDAGLVRETDAEPGRPRYGAVFFEPVPDAALVLGLDLGARFLRGAICDLAGTVRARQDVELRNVEVDSALEAIGKLRTSLVEASGLPDAPAGQRGRRRPRRRRRRDRAAEHGDERPGPRGPRLPCRPRRAAGPAGHARQRHQPRRTRGAVARRRGRGRGLRLPLGGHRARRGARPPRRAPPRPERRRRRGRPRRLGARGRDRPVRRRRLGARRAPGRRGSPDAARAALRRARRVRRRPRRRRARRARWSRRRPGASRCTSPRSPRVTDVALVVLGGGIGANGDLLLDPIRGLLAEWLPFPPRLEVSGVGDAAVLTGALAVGLEIAQESVFANR